MKKSKMVVTLALLASVGLVGCQKNDTAKINELLEYNFDENLNAFNKYSDFDIRLNEEKLKEYGGEIKNNNSNTSEGDFSVEIIEGI